MRRYLALVRALVGLDGRLQPQPPIVRILKLAAVARIAAVRVLADRQQIEIGVAAFPTHPRHLRRKWGGGGAGRENARAEV